MRVLVVDDSSAFRSAARTFLERRGYQVVGEARTVASALELVRRLNPGGVLLDVLLPDGTGFEAAADITRRSPGIAVVLTSTHDFGYCYSLADECGARGFVLKSRLAACDLSRYWPAEPYGVGG